jgi:hypothetical protein
MPPGNPFLLTDALQRTVARYAREGRLGELPPVITFRSVMDATVTTSAVVSAFYDRLPNDGSELVLFDLNRNTKFGPGASSVGDDPRSTAAKGAAEFPNGDRNQCQSEQKRCHGTFYRTG